MEKIVLWGKEIDKDFAGATEEQLDDFLELMHFVQKIISGTPFVKLHWIKKNFGNGFTLKIKLK